MADGPQNKSTQNKHRDKKRRKGRATPKGRQLNQTALAQVQNLLNGQELRRDLLIEHLHLIQDKYNGLSLDHLAALAHEHKLSQTEVYEVADFYAHFDILREGETAPPLTVRVCSSLPCVMAAADELYNELASDYGKGTTWEHKVQIKRAPCMGRCHSAPAVEVGRRHIDEADYGVASMIIEGGDYRARIGPYGSFKTYRSEGGYQLLEQCLAGQHKVENIIEDLSDSGLRGLGGAGFPSGTKWSIVRSYKGPRLMTVNGDEGEPGTFKDRYYLEHNPHQFLEGALIAAWAVEAERCYIYIRDEYPGVHKILSDEIEELNRAGLTKHCPLELRRGAGAYICGEESAMIESIEGKRGLPRHRPPYIAEKGLFDRPTLNHNVETLYWIRSILENGAKWFADQGVRGAKGMRSYSVSGRVAKPGVVFAAAGSTVEELIDLSGGMADGHKFAAYLPGGASGGILPASKGDLPLDFGTLEKYGAFVGSHAVVILSDQDDLKKAAHNLVEFFAEESCGQCTPCRVGCEKASVLMEAPEWEEEKLRDLCEVMGDASICGLGQAAPNPILSLYTHFPELFKKQEEKVDG